MSKERSTAVAARPTTSAPHASSRARNRGQARPRVTWRYAAAACAVLVIAVLGWLLSQSRASSSTGAALVGKPAPLAGLRLASSQGRPVSLAQYHGRKVVLFFYEGSTCGSCQQQLSLIQNLIAKRHDSVAVAASVDPAATSANVAQQLRLTYPILADVNHQLGSAFGDFHVEVAGMDMGDVDNHAVYELDQHGVVRWAKQAASTMWVPEGDITSALDQS
jgi:peroxiredoxin Q/BCP